MTDFAYFNRGEAIQQLAGPADTVGYDYYNRAEPFQGMYIVSAAFDPATLIHMSVNQSELVGHATAQY